MDKISSILPGNRRVKSVDVEDAQPIRPGVTSYGRPVGTTSSEREQMKNHLAEQAAMDRASDRVSLSPQAMAQSGKPEQPIKAAGDQNARIADDVSHAFADTQSQLREIVADNEGLRADHVMDGDHLELGRSFNKYA